MTQSLGFAIFAAGFAIGCCLKSPHCNLPGWAQIRQSIDEAEEGQSVAGLSLSQGVRPSSDYFVAGFLSVISLCLSIALDFEAVLLSALTELATIFPSFSL